MAYIIRQATEYEVTTFVDKYSQMDKTRKHCWRCNTQGYFHGTVIPTLKQGKAIFFSGRIVNPPVLKLNNLTLDKLKNKK